MQDSASMLDAMLGVALLNRAARDEQDRRQANEMKRRLSWLSSSYSRYESGLAEDEDEALSEEERYHRSLLNEIGRASCRERVSGAVVAVSCTHTSEPRETEMTLKSRGEQDSGIAV